MTDYTIPLVVFCAIALVLWLRWQVKTYHSAPVAARPDRHLPPDEYALLGDDWRDCVGGYFRESHIRRTRNRFAIYSVTGADPNSESRDLAGSGSLATKEETLARTGH